MDESKVIRSVYLEAAKNLLWEMASTSDVELRVIKAKIVIEWLQKAREA